MRHKDTRKEVTVRREKTGCLFVCVCECVCYVSLSVSAHLCVFVFVVCMCTHMCMFKSVHVHACGDQRTTSVR